jgi:hypothetical protein
VAGGTALFGAVVAAALLPARPMVEVPAVEQAATELESEAA